MATNIKWYINNVEVKLDQNGGTTNQSINKKPVTSLKVYPLDGSDFQPKREQVIKGINELTGETFMNNVIKEVKTDGSGFKIDLIGQEIDLYRYYFTGKLEEGITIYDAIIEVYNRSIINKGLSIGIIDTAELQAVTLDSGGFIERRPVGILIDELLAFVDGYWWVDFENKINIRKKGNYIDAPFTLDNTVVGTEINGIEVVESGKDYYNEILLVGGFGKGLERIETYTPESGDVDTLELIQPNIVRATKDIYDVEPNEFVITTSIDPLDGTNFFRDKLYDRVGSVYSQFYDNPIFDIINRRLPALADRVSSYHDPFLAGEQTIATGFPNLREEIEEIENLDSLIDGTLRVSKIEYKDFLKEARQTSNNIGSKLAIYGEVTPVAEFTEIGRLKVSEVEDFIGSVIIVTIEDDDEEEFQVPDILNLLKRDEIFNYFIGETGNHPEAWNFTFEASYIPTIKITFQWEELKWVDNGDGTWTYKPVVSTTQVTRDNAQFTQGSAEKGDLVANDENDVDPNFTYELTYTPSESIQISLKDDTEIDRIAFVRGIGDGRIQKVINDTNIVSWDDGINKAQSLLKYHAREKLDLKYTTFRTDLEVGMVHKNSSITYTTGIYEADFIITSIQKTIWTDDGDDLKILTTVVCESNIDPNSNLHIFNKKKPTLPFKEGLDNPLTDGFSDIVSIPTCYGLLVGDINDDAFYPEQTLYPSETLFPQRANEINFIYKFGDCIRLRRTGLKPSLTMKPSLTLKPQSVKIVEEEIEDPTPVQQAQSMIMKANCVGIECRLAERKINGN